ncbi:MAG TPA: sigma-54 dependent transcriptional regulator [Steroidobacteraceae bacterium]|nr:sigma-54 dependent transcriptional regulator [Steroidobacteraceae bacterium]
MYDVPRGEGAPKDTGSKDSPSRKVAHGEEEWMQYKGSHSTASLGFGIHRGEGAPKDAESKDSGRKARILVVDDDVESLRFLNTRLGDGRYRVDTADNSQAALDACVRSRPNLVISELRLEPIDGLALLKELKSRWPTLTVIIVTAHATIPDAVRATQCGAFGFLVKPIERKELLGQVERALAASSFALAEGDWRSDIVTRSQLMEERLGLANRAAGSDAPVMLTGENGTGKELLARAIHAASSRRDQRFVAIRCKDADEGALEAQLFGRVATVGGNRTREAGALEEARGGTLLLDDIDHLPPRLQSELLATLGDPTTSRAPRLISTTSRDLKKLMEAGDFRQDLYYHLNVLPIEIPPLGRRREDIPLLVSHFLEQASEEGGAKKIYSPEAIELLATTDWPGNVRQLFELVKQNVALSHGKIMSKEFVERSLGADMKKVPSYHEAR